MVMDDDLPPRPLSERADAFLAALPDFAIGVLSRDGPLQCDALQLPPLIRLPRDEIRVKPYSDTHLCAAFYTRCGSLYWQKVRLLDLPNDFLGIKDLELHGVLHIYVAAVEKLIDGRTNALLRRPLEGREGDDLAH